METKQKCFVIMPFAEEFNKIYELAIRPAVEKMSYECIRADEITGSGSVVRHIVESTNEADAVIADITDNNANVMYELGLAHGLRKHVILLTQDISKAPFDLKNYRIVEYDGKSFGGSDTTREKITKSLGALNDKRQSRTNPVHDFLPDAVNETELAALKQENARLQQQNLKLEGSAELAESILREVGSKLGLHQIQQRLHGQPENEPVGIPLGPSESGRKLVFKRVPKSKRVEVRLPTSKSIK